LTGKENQSNQAIKNPGKVEAAVGGTIKEEFGTLRRSKRKTFVVLHLREKKTPSSTGEKIKRIQGRGGGRQKIERDAFGKKGEKQTNKKQWDADKKIMV